MTNPAQNTDRELWREREGDYYAPHVFVTESGGIGISVGGLVLVKTLREWHALGRAALEAGPGPSPPEQIQRIADWLKATFPHGISWAAVGPYSAAQMILDAVRGKSVLPR